RHPPAGRQADAAVPHSLVDHRRPGVGEDAERRERQPAVAVLARSRRTGGAGLVHAMIPLASRWMPVGAKVSARLRAMEERRATRAGGRLLRRFARRRLPGAPGAADAPPAPRTAPARRGGAPLAAKFAAAPRKRLPHGEGRSFRPKGEISPCNLALPGGP